MMLKKQTVLVIEYTELPEEMKEIVRDDWRFRNDVSITHVSEMAPCGDDETWGENLSREAIEEYHKGQVEENGYEGDFDKFLEDYGLAFDMWLLGQDIDLSDVRVIYIDICW